jgi:hypothetical protein
MNRRNTLTLTTVALLCITVALPSGDAAARQKTLKEQLAGVWTFVSSEATLPNGSKQLSNTKGILILDAGGRYALVGMRPDRPKFKASAFDTSDAEYGAAARAFAANFGTWSVNEADKTLVRQFEGALVPNNEGIEAKSSVNLAGDELRLVGTLPSGRVYTDVLRRAK